MMKARGMSTFRRVFVHEVLMCAMLVQILLRLILGTREYGWIAAYVFILAMYGILIHSGRNTLSPLLNRLRLAWNIVAMNLAFASIRYIVPALGLEVMDAQLARLDVLLLGGDLSVWAQRYYTPALTEIMSLGYMLFIVFLFFSFCYYGFGRELSKLLLFCSGLFTLYAFGISGYTIVPAQGPWAYYAADFTVVMEGYLFTDLNRTMVAVGSSGYDVFPSLHVGAGLYMFLFFARFDRRVWRIYLIPFILLVISTIYLRYHYFIDLVFGAALSLACFYCCLWFGERQEPEAEVSSPR
jgi:membrane-associated phospholipid phosphatase